MCSQDDLWGWMTRFFGEFSGANAINRVFDGDSGLVRNAFWCLACLHFSLLSTQQQCFNVLVLFKPSCLINVLSRAVLLHVLSKAVLHVLHCTLLHPNLLRGTSIPLPERYVPLCVAFARRFSLFIVGSIAAYIFSGSIVGIFLSKGVITSAFLSHLRNDLSLPHHDGFFAAPSILSLNLRYARLRIFVRHHTWLCPLYASTRGSLWIQVAPYTRTTPNLSSTIPLT